MDFKFSKEQEDFRQEVREFCSKEPWGEIVSELDFLSPSLWRKIGEKGWLGIAFPKEYGGLGKDEIYEAIFLEEMSNGGMPFGSVTYSVTVTLFANVIFRCGTERQKKEILPRVFKGEITATQMYTEPEAGSDLSSVSTTAVRQGDHYILNGQKMFSTLFEAPYSVLMAKTDTDAPPEKGISLFIFDKRSPGLSRTPIHTMFDCPTNQVFLDNVKIPAEDLIGEENRGWEYHLKTKPFYLHKGRVSMLVDSQKTLDSLVKYVKETEINGQPLSRNPAVRQKLAEMAIDIKAFRLLVYRMAWMLSEGLDVSDCATSLAVISNDISLRLGNKTLQVLGLLGQLGGGASYAPFSGMMEAIYRGGIISHFNCGGSTVARNVLATERLGLPEN